jgi:hypothetical protein
MSDWNSDLYWKSISLFEIIWKKITEPESDFKQNDSESKSTSQ